MWWPLPCSVMFARTLCPQKEAGRNVSCGCRERGSLGTAPICLPVCVREPGVREGSAPLWVCTPGLSREGRGERIAGELPGGARVAAEVDVPREGSRGAAEPGPHSGAGTPVQFSFHPALCHPPGTVEVSSSSILPKSTYPPHDPRSQLLSIQDQPGAGGTCPRATGHPQHRCWGRGC